LLAHNTRDTRPRTSPSIGNPTTDRHHDEQNRQTYLKSPACDERDSCEGNISCSTKLKTIRFRISHHDLASDCDEEPPSHTRYRNTDIRRLQPLTNKHSSRLLFPLESVFQRHLPGNHLLTHHQHTRAGADSGTSPEVRFDIGASQPQFGA
jgi:hypothetical protein